MEKTAILLKLIAMENLFRAKNNLIKSNIP
jgi:hypothetical protein